jgi:shikimate kinase
VTAVERVVLVGLMGSGKTTVGRLVADELGWPLVDTDHVIEARTGRTVREIWLADGEPAFRRLETEVVADALGAAGPSVVAAAGGVVLSDANRRLLTSSGALVVWLAAEADVLVERTAAGDHRPLLDADPLAALRAMADERAVLYREVADAVVDVGERPPADIAAEIIGLVTRG